MASRLCSVGCRMRVTEKGRLSLNAAWVICHSVSPLYIEIEGTRLPLVAAERDGKKYVRAAPTDTADDPLLTLPEC